jgi:DNA-binding NtrC family response regulator
MSRVQETVLVVEDDPITREILSKSLQDGGFGVRVVSTGEEALMILRLEAHTVDWLVTDINLGGLTQGWVVGAEFDRTHPHRSVIYTSAAKQALFPSSGAVYVSKPFDARHIVDLVRDLSNRNAEQPEAASQ